jgi:hypothetical protein
MVSLVPSPEAGGSPFLRAGVEPGRARTWIAVLRSATGAEVDRLVLKLPGEEWGETPFPGEGPLTHAAREAEWAAAHADLLRLLAAPGCFPELVLPAAGADGTLPLLPPLWYCPTAGRLFRIPCPRCSAPLATCRDDAALAAAGLPLFAAGAARFLTCPACAAQAAQDEEVPRFWAATKADAKGLGDKVALLDDLRQEISAAKSSGANVPETPASGWLVFNPHDSPYQVTRLAPLAFDTFLERLGGVPDGETSSAGASGTLFAAEGSGIDSVEALCLKLTAFLQIVAALRQHYLLLDRPHLDLHPGHLVVEPGPRSGFLPSLWSFRVKLLGASSARPVPLTPSTAGISVPLPPPAPKAPFASPAVRAARQASPSVGELMVDRVLAEKKGDLWRIEGTLLDKGTFYPPPTLRDWIQLAWPEDLFGPGQTAVARLDPRTVAQGVEAAITTEPLALDPALARRLGRAGGFRIPGVRYRIYPALGIAEDLYSLGVLLLRILLVNDGQGIAALMPLLDALPQPGAASLSGGRHTVEEALAAMIAAEPERVAKSNLFHRAVERTPERPNALPDDLWKGALLFALRLAARGPGFGLTPEPGGTFGWNETSPATHLDAVEAEAADLVRNLQTLLFQRQMVHADIQAVIAELLEES